MYAIRSYYERKAAILMEVSNVAFMQGDLDRAADALKQVSVIQEAQNDHSSLGVTLGNLGSILLEKKDLDGADAAYKKAIEIKEKQQDVKSLADRNNFV